jgi:hypothetical protein
VLLAVLAAGCGQQQIYPVHGQLVDPDGNPILGMKDGSVDFEALDAKASANASIGEDGSFRLTTNKPGDGAYLGRHRVAITRPYFGPERPAPYVIDPKYEKFETSELVVTVEAKVNQIKLKVERYKGRKR